MGKLTGKTALITGALQGIGEGIARIFTRHGVNLILLDISPEIGKLADELCGCDRYCTAIVADIHDPASVATTIRRTREKERHIDILVNNTGVYRLGSFLDMSDDDRDFHIDINTKGVWNIMKAMLLEMIARKGDRIMMMSLVTGDMVADPDEMAYALTKAATVGLAKSLAAEYVQSGIRVSTVCPEYVCAPMAESIARQSNPEDPKSVLAEMAKVIPVRRLVDPLEVGKLAAFPASGESSYLTGTRNVVGDGSVLPETASVGI